MEFDKLEGMMRTKLPFPLFCCFTMLWLAACEDEVRNPLQTDQAVEGTEIFDVSFALSENLYYAMLPFETYELAFLDSIPLPGCPSLEVNGTTREVRLAFPENCPSSSVQRRGAIIIDFSDSDTLTKTLTYQDYGVRSSQLNGIRHFSQGAGQNTFEEQFEDVIHLNDKDFSTRVAGEFTHELQFLENNLVRFSSTGIGHGRNLAGRNFSKAISAPIVFDTDCIESGKFLPSSGSVTWSISRGVQDVQHQLLFGLDGECDNKASVTLADGRNIEFAL